MHWTVPHHQQGPALRGDGSNVQGLFFTLNLALISNSTNVKEHSFPRQVSQRFVIRTFRHISHLMLTFNGFNAIVCGSHKEQVPSRTFREHSQILTNRVNFFYCPGKDTSIHTEGEVHGRFKWQVPTPDLE